MAHDFGASPQPGHAGPQPFIPQTPAAAAPVLPHGPRPAFYLRHHPLRWMLVDGEWLPQLGHLKVDLGVGGVDKSGNMDEAVIMSDKGGWQILPWDVLGDPYIRAWPCAGGLHHCTKWETPRAVGGRILPPDVDEKGYRDFLRQLLAQGVIAPPDPSVLEATLIDSQRKRVDNLRGQTHKPGVAEVFDVEKARLGEMQAAAELLEAPKKKGRGKPSAEAV